jgi:hypothetical protein
LQRRAQQPRLGDLHGMLVGNRQRVIRDRHFEPRQRAPAATDHVERPELGGLAEAGASDGLADLASEARFALRCQFVEPEHAQRQRDAFPDLAFRHLDQLQAAAAKVADNAVRLGDGRNHPLPRQPALFLAGKNARIEANRPHPLEEGLAVRGLADGGGGDDADRGAPSGDVKMGAALVRVVATAAVREASNGKAFLKRVRAIGFDPRILSGEEEGRLAGQGVISAIPQANGIVGDLGGGSLELVEVAEGKVGKSVSLPLGVLRLDELAAQGEASFARKIGKAVAGAGFGKAAEFRPFYMVGGSWRALARLEMAIADHPLPITHQHAMEVTKPRLLRAALQRLDKEAVRNIPSVPLYRLPTLPLAAQLLEALVEVLRPNALVVSSFGIREGLLYDELDGKTRSLDPLVEAAREAGAGLGRFEQHGTLLDAWIAPLFDDSRREARLRLAACLLADIAWAAHPDFRAERGVDMALHGNWVAIDAPGG